MCRTNNRWNPQEKRRDFHALERMGRCGPATLVSKIDEMEGDPVSQTLTIPDAIYTLVRNYNHVIWFQKQMIVAPTPEKILFHLQMFYLFSIPRHPSHHT